MVWQPFEKESIFLSLNYNLFLSKLVIKYIKMAQKAAPTAGRAGMTQVEVSVTPYLALT